MPTLDEQILALSEGDAPTGSSLDEAILGLSGEPPVDNAGALQAGIEQFGKAASFGFTPELSAAVQRALPSPTSDVDAALRAQGFNIQEAPEASFAEAAAQERARLAEQEKQFPTASMIGGGLGLVGGGGAGGAALRGAGRALAPQLAAKLGQAGLAGSAITGAAEGAALTAAEQGSGLEDVGTGTAIGAGVELAPPALRALGRGAKRLGKAGFSAAFGVKTQAVEELLKRADEVKNLENIDQIAAKVEDAVNKIKQTDIEVADQVQEDVLLALNSIKQQTDDASAAAFEILEKSDNSFDLNDIKRVFLKQKQGLTGRTGSTNNTARQAIDNFLDSIDENIATQKTVSITSEGVEELDLESITGPQLKRLIQDLDAEIRNVNQVAGGYLTPTERALTQARSGIDKLLKSQEPEYAEIMKQVRPLAEFGSRASRLLGKPDQALSSARKLIKSGAKDEKTKALQDLAAKEKIDLTRLQRAQADAEMFKSWNSWSMNQRIQGMIRGLNDQTRTQLKALSSASDQDFIKQFETLNLSHQFDQEFLRGSRNVNLWALIGLGTFFGNIGGGAVGAAIGALMDKYGPQTAKRILLGISDMKGSVTVPKIMSLDVPKNVKEDLANSFRATVVRASVDDEPIRVPPESRAGLRMDILNDEVLSPREKMKNIDMINKHGKVDPSIRKMFAGDTKFVPEKVPGFEPKKPKQPARPFSEAAEFVKYRRPQEY